MEDEFKQPLLIALDIEVPNVTRERRQAGRPRIEGRGNERNPYKWKRAEYWREQGRERKKRNDEKKRSWLAQVKEQLGCQVCGETAWATLHFHHIDGNTKTGSPSELYWGGRWDAFRMEIAKCALVCATCHHKLHHHGLSIDLKPIDISALPPMPGRAA